jgi:subfamily B ATP-binding cassette protein MsbA
MSEARDPLLRLLREALRFPSRLAVAILSVIGLGLSQLYLTWLVKRWVEGPLMTGDPAALRSLMMQAGAVTLATMLFLFLSRTVITGINQRVIERLRNTAVERIFASEVASVRRHPSGELLSRLFNDVGVLSTFFSTILRRFIRETIVAAGAIVMMFVLHWRLALATFALVPVTGFLLVKIGAVIRRWGSVAQREIGNLSATFNEQIHGFSTIKGYQTETFEAERFAAQNRVFREKVMRGELWSALLMCAVFLATGAGLLAIVWTGSVQLTSGAISQATLLAFALYAAQTVEPLRRLSEIHGYLQLSLAAAARVYQIIDIDDAEAPAPRASASGTASAPPQGARGAIAIERLSFAWREDTPVLRDVALTIAAHEQIAVAGSSGSGKSTLAAILLRFAQPRSGRVLIDGVDHTAIPLGELRRMVCLVEQEPFLFSGPLIDNIRYGTWDASRLTIERAVDMAGLRELVSRLPHGLDTSLREAGRDLSGGERQRVALARAIVRDPLVLILDEATSAIDSEIESGIFEQLSPWLSQRTVLAMAHRLSTIARFDRVALLEDGRVTASGSLQTMVRSSVGFRSLFHEQLGVIPFLSHDPVKSSGRSIPYITNP